MASLETTLQLLSPYPPGWGGTLLKGAASTLAISAGAYLIGIVIGLAGALGKLASTRPRPKSTARCTRRSGTIPRISM